MTRLVRRAGDGSILASRWRDVVCLLLLIVALRLPFFFRAVINWDESSQILMGQSLLDGYLPYIELWDNKPPLSFAFYAVAIVLFGKSILAIRLFGMLCVAAAALLTYGIGTRQWNARIGLLGAILFVFLASALEGHNTTTEHIAMVPLLGAVALVMSREFTPKVLFAVGAMMGIASLVRLNLAYTGAAFGVFLLFQFGLDRTPWGIALRGVMAYVSGIVFVVLATFFPYLATGSGQVWWLSVIVAPLAYSDEMSARQALVEHVSYVLWNRSSPMALTALVWGGGLLGCAHLVARWTKMSAADRRQCALFLVFMGGTAVSILKSGTSAQHYLIQLAPFMALLTAIPVVVLLSGRFRVLAAVGVMVALLMSMRPILLESRLLTTRALRGDSLSYGAAYDIAAFLKQSNLSRERIYLMDDHVAYWFLDAKPVSKVSTHPSNIGREHLLASVVGPGSTTESEMAYILGRHPRVIVRKPGVWYLVERPAARSLLDASLREQYELAAEVSGRLVYLRKP